MLLKILGLRHIAPLSLTGKTVWIIGASSGLGAALAMECAASGAKVALSARRKSLLEQVRTLLPGEGHLVLPMDVTDMPSFRRAFEQLKAQWNLADIAPTEQGEAHAPGLTQDSQRAKESGGESACDEDKASLMKEPKKPVAELPSEQARGAKRRGERSDGGKAPLKIDYIIYNSGTRPVPEWSQFNAEEQLEGLDVNLGGTLRLLELMIPQWQRQDGGNLLLIGSLIATGAMPLAGVYGASKAGLAYLAENLAMDLAPMKVKVQLASPGFIDTPLVAFRPRRQMPLLMPANKAAWKIRKLMGREDVFEIHFPKPLSLTTKLARWLLPRSWWMALLSFLERRTQETTES